MHIDELGNTKPESPVLFIKPKTAIVHQPTRIALPSFTMELHHEAELVLRISKLAKDVARETALDCVDAITIGLDLTARDIQRELKSKKLPWEKSKAFDGSAVLGKFLPLSNKSQLFELLFSLDLNGELKQMGNTKDMLFGPEEIISYCSKFFTLERGDYIFTGTPKGVGPLTSGDKIVGKIREETLLEVVVD